MNTTRLSRVLITVICVFTLMGILCTTAFAADQYQNLGLKYGDIVPTNSKLSTQVKSYTFYGDSCKLYFMRISKGVENARYAVEIFSDSQYKNQIRGYSNKHIEEPGNEPFSITWGFKDLKGGTYYGRCYSYIEVDGVKTIDSSSLKTFTIKIDRLGKRKVPLAKITNTSNGPQITWRQLPTATQYNVYRRAAGEKGWKYLKTVGAATTSYTDPTAKSGTYYAYTVKAKDGKAYTSTYDTKGLKTYYLSQPTLKDVNGTSYLGSAKITWTAVPGAQGYYIYRKGGSLSNYEWTAIATIKNGKTTSYVDKTAKSADWAYTYTVKAYKGSYTGAHNATGLDFDYIAAPKITKVAPHNEGMQIAWSNTNPNVTKYYVYRREGSKWKLLGTTKDKSFIDKTAVSNNTYRYTVKAASDINVGGYNKNGLSGKFIAAPSLQPLTFDSKYRSVIKWSAVDGAASYKIYRKVDNAQKWSLVATVKGNKKTSYYDACKKGSGRKYTYTVRAYDSNGKSGWFIPTGTSSIILAKPQFTVAQKDTENKSLAIEMNWTGVKGATGYNVYRRLPGGKWETLAKAIDATNYVDSAIKSGTAYQYALRAVNTTGSISYYYTKSATAVQIPVMSKVLVEDAGVSISWSAVEGATYNVYRAPFGTDDWTLAGNSTTAAFIDKHGDAKLNPYDYAVTAVVNKVESVKSAKVSNSTEITATATFDEATKKITVAWKSPLAESVIISKVTNNEEPVDLGVFTASIYKDYADANVEEGKKYTYTLTAQSANKVNGKVTVTATYPLPPLKATTVNKITTDYNNGDPTCTIMWTPVEFATEYKVLRSENKKDYYSMGTVKAEDIKDGSFMYTDHITADTVYNYTIEALSTEDRKSSYSAVTSDICAYSPLDAVSDLKATGERNDDEKISVTLTWAETKYAEKYIVSRKAAEGEYEDLATFVLSEGSELPLTYTDKTAEPGVSYTYKVTASNAKRGSVSNEVAYLWKSN